MDIQRTVLWVVFSLSLLLLWDNWMRHTGRPSMFFPGMTSQEAKPAAGGAPKSDVPHATQANTAAAPTAATVPGGNAAAVQGQRITNTTDVVKADIDTLGGELVRLELLKQRDTTDPSKNVVLFDSEPNRTYLGQPGLIGGPYPKSQIKLRCLAWTARPRFGQP